jgi:hypothetical protein
MTLRTFWLIISFVLHPLLLISYAYAILFYALPYYKARFFDENTHLLLLYVAANTFVLPIISLLVLKRIGYINDLYLNQRKDRTLPYAMTVVFCGITTWQLYTSQLGELSYRFMLGITLLITFITLLNLRFKISAHASAAAGVCGLLFYTLIGLNEGSMIYWLLLFCFLSGWSAASRLALKVHSPAEIYWGFLLGFCTVFCSVAL